MPKKKHKKKATKKKAARKKTKSACPPGLFSVSLSCGAGGVTQANPNKVNKVSKKAKDEVKWHSGKNFTVDFDKPEGSPFAASHFQGGPGNPAYSGSVVGSNFGDYGYTAKVEGCKAKDPIIHTDP